MSQSYCQCQAPVVEGLFTLSGGYGLERCGKCGLVWLAPQPDEAVLERAYAADYYTSSEAKFAGPVEAWTRYAARRRARRLLRRHGSAVAPLKILDIGCGRGVLLQGFAVAGHEVLGLERSGAGFENNPHVETVPLAELVAQQRRFDVIVLWHVLEHLPNPEEVLGQVRQLLSPGGSVFVEVPNFASWQARLFRRHWFHLDAPRHLFHFDPRSLKAMLARCGFALRSQSTFSPDQHLYGFIQSALNALPGLPPDHLYSLLKSPGRPGALIKLVLYSPLVIVLLVLALLELPLALLCGRGAVLSIHARHSGGDDS